MRNIFILLVLLGYACKPMAQLVLKADSRIYGPRVALSMVPPMPVMDGAGNKYKLDEYIRNNRPYPSKPILIVTWFTFCGGCKRQFDSLSAKGFGDRYNVVTILLKLGDTKRPETKSLDEYMNEGNDTRDWNKFMNLVSVDSMAEKHLWDGYNTPMFVMADKDLKVYQSHTALSMKMVDVSEAILSSLDKGTYKTAKGMRYYDEDGFPVVPSSTKAASTFYSYKSGQHIITEIRGIADSSKNIYRYLLRNNEFIYDGNFEDYDKNGKLSIRSSYREGALSETFRRNHDNGKIAAIIPVDGIAKTFDTTGRLKMEGPMKSGLGDGIFKQYVEGKLVSETTIRNGVIDGPARYYKDGKLTSTDNYKNGKLVEKKD